MTSPQPTRRRRRLWRALAVVVAVPVVLLVLVAMLQRQLIFFPDTRDPASVTNHLADGDVDGDDVVLRTEDGLDLDAWLLRPSGSTDRSTAVLYCPGNGGNRLGRLEVGRAIAAQGFTVLLLEYRGYGGNPGSPSEDGLARDARAAAAFLRDEGFDPDRTVVVGESIGTGVASRLVTTDPPAALLLRSPFTSLADVASGLYPGLPVRQLLRDRFESAGHLRDSEVPVLVLHGDADDVVPSRLSAELATQVGNLHGEVVVPGAGHNDELWFGQYLADAVTDLADATIP